MEADAQLPQRNLVISRLQQLLRGFQSNLILSGKKNLSWFVYKTIALIYCIDF